MKEIEEAFKPFMSILKCHVVCRVSGLPTSLRRRSGNEKDSFLRQFKSSGLKSDRKGEKKRLQTTTSRPALTSLEESTMRILAAEWG